MSSNICNNAGQSMSQQSQSHNKSSKKVTNTTGGSGATATLSSLASKKNRQFQLLNINMVLKMMEGMMNKKTAAVKKKNVKVRMRILKMSEL